MSAAGGKDGTKELDRVPACISRDVYIASIDIATTPTTNKVQGKVSSNATKVFGDNDGTTNSMLCQQGLEIAAQIQVSHISIYTKNSTPVGFRHFALHPQLFMRQSVINQNCVCIEND